MKRIWRESVNGDVGIETAPLSQLSHYCILKISMETFFGKGVAAWGDTVVKS
jgi:hypothetical protein